MKGDEFIEQIRDVQNNRKCCHPTLASWTVDSSLGRLATHRWFQATLGSGGFSFWVGLAKGEPFA
ncbi:MAG: hypothetical protein C4288_02905 [Leptolyngbya sp. ERB_1_1]